VLADSLKGDYNMRKVLLATTALVAMGAATAATADVTISGAFEVKYKTWSDNTASSSTNNTSISDTTTVTISMSETLDNGMSTSMSVYSNGNGTGAFDAIGGSLSGDFGTIGIGVGGENGDGFATATDVTPEEAHSISVSGAAYGGSTTTATEAGDYDGTNDVVLPADEQVAPADISYTSPNINGFQFSVGYADTGAYEDTSTMGAMYSTAAAGGTITLKYAVSNHGNSTSTTTDEVDATSAGLVLAMGDATVTVATNTVSYGEVTDYSATSAGITYVVSDALTLSAYTGSTEDSKQATYSLDDTGVGFVYTITPGLALHATQNSWDFKGEGSGNENGDQTSIALNMSF